MLIVDLSKIYSDSIVTENQKEIIRQYMWKTDLLPTDGLKSNKCYDHSRKDFIAPMSIKSFQHFPVKLSIFNNSDVIVNKDYNDEFYKFYLAQLLIIHKGTA